MWKRTVAMGKATSHLDAIGKRALAADAVLLATGYEDIAAAIGSASRFSGGSYRDDAPHLDRAQYLSRHTGAIDKLV